MSQTRVAVVFGSDSDWPTMKKCVELLKNFDLSPSVEVLSAHRTPDRVREFSTSAKQNGIQVIIAGAGMSAALAGAIASHTTLPVIGVPLASGDLQGLDALLTTTQMPPGVPVASVGIGSAGAKNAALIAVQILALQDSALADAYAKYKSDQADSVKDKNRDLQSKLDK